MIVQFKEEEIDIMITALNQWGLNAQIDQAIEECAELIVALNKHVKRTPKPEADDQRSLRSETREQRPPRSETLDHVLDEIADVEMMLAQLRIAFDIDDSTLRKRIEYKFKKLNQYLADDK